MSSPRGRVIPKTIIKMVQTASLHGTHALGLEFGSAARLSKRSGSVWNCLWRHALKRSPGIIRKSRVSYHGPGFLSSATWPSLLKKHYNGIKNKPLNTCAHTMCVMIIEANCLILVGYNTAITKDNVI